VQGAPAWVTEEAVHLENVASIQRAHGITFDDSIGHPIKDSDLDTTGKGGMGQGTGNAESDTIHRLRAGIEWELHPDNVNYTGGARSLPQSSIPVLFDTVVAEDPNCDIHGYRGINVLYMDGHVESIWRERKYPNSADARRVIDTYDF